MTQTPGRTELGERERQRSAHDRLCEEHQTIGRELKTLAAVADALGSMPADTLRAQIEQAHQLVAARIVPHLEAEAALRAHLAFRDHRPTEVDAVTRDIEGLKRRLDDLTAHLANGSGASAHALREVLYDIRTLAHSHFAEEL